MFDDDEVERGEIRAVLERHEDLGEAAIAAVPGLWPDYPSDIR